MQVNEAVCLSLLLVATTAAVCLSAQTLNGLLCTAARVREKKEGTAIMSCRLSTQAHTHWFTCDARAALAFPSPAPASSRLRQQQQLLNFPMCQRGRHNNTGGDDDCSSSSMNSEPSPGKAVGWPVWPGADLRIDTTGAVLCLPRRLLGTPPPPPPHLYV